MIIFIKLEIFLSSRNLPQNGEDCDVQNKKYYGWGTGGGRVRVSYGKDGVSSVHFMKAYEVEV